MVLMSTTIAIGVRAARLYTEELSLSTARGEQIPSWEVCVGELMKGRFALNAEYLPRSRNFPPRIATTISVPFSIIALVRLSEKFISSVRETVCCDEEKAPTSLSLSSLNSPTFSNISSKRKKGCFFPAAVIISIICPAQSSVP